MATTGRIEVSVPKMSVTTSSTVSGTFFGEYSGNFNPYTFPFPGTVTKVVINTLSGASGLGGGTFWLTKAVGSVPPANQLDPLVLTLVTGIQEYAVNYPFNANDGFMFDMVSASAGEFFSFFIEVEYDLV